MELLSVERASRCHLARGEHQVRDLHIAQEPFIRSVGRVVERIEEQHVRRPVREVRRRAREQGEGEVDVLRGVLQADDRSRAKLEGRDEHALNLVERHARVEQDPLRGRAMRDGDLRTACAPSQCVLNSATRARASSLTEKQSIGALPAAAANDCEVEGQGGKRSRRRTRGLRESSTGLWISQCEPA